MKTKVENEANFEEFMEKYESRKKHTIVWRVFTTLCLIAIILLIILRVIHCDCAYKSHDTASNDSSYSTQINDEPTSQN